MTLRELSDNTTFLDNDRNKRGNDRLQVAAKALSLLQEGQADRAVAKALTRHRLADSTKRGYRSDVADWIAYAERHGLPACPVTEPGAAQYVGHLARKGLKRATVKRRLAALNALNREAGDVPLSRTRLDRMLRGFSASKTKKRPLTADMAVRIVALIPGDAGLRDRALFLVGVVTGMRRSELARLAWDDVSEAQGGLVLQIPFSKTDQQGEGHFVVVPYAQAEEGPAEALLAWRALQGGGATVFGMSDRTIARTVKRYIAKIGHDPTEYSGHSFRAGFATTAKMEGATVAEYAEQTRHSNLQVAADYAHDVDRMSNRAVVAVHAALLRGPRPN